MALIELDKVSKIYTPEGPAIPALTEISLDIDSGEFLCIAGPSGSGKSTLLNLIGILDFPTTGTVKIDNRLTSRLSRTEAAIMRRDSIGFVFQTFNLIQVLSAWENIEYSLILRRKTRDEQKKIISEIMTAVGLGDKMHKKVTELSGGEQQRVAIARAIAAEPKVVLADEPTANLDSETGLAIIELFKSINQKRGTTFIFSSHDLRITSLANRTLYLRDGRLAKD